MPFEVYSAHVFNNSFGRVWSYLILRAIPVINEINALREVFGQRMGKFLLKSIIPLCKPILLLAQETSYERVITILLNLSVGELFIQYKNSESYHMTYKGNVKGNECHCPLQQLY